MTLALTSDAVAAMKAHAASEHPHEACGILLGEALRIQATQACANVHPDPGTHFEIDPQALIDAHRAAREGGRQVLGYYHSHPNGRGEPSATDCAAASGDGRIWAIVAEGQVTLWRDEPGGFRPIGYSLDRP